MSPALLNGSQTNGVHANDNNKHTNGVHKPRQYGFATRAIHVGSEPSSETGAVIPAISLSTTYQQTGVGIHKGFEYSRSGNPNRNAFEATLASIEAGGAYALAYASGSATTAAVIQSLGPDAHILSVNDVYGGSFRYMRRVAAKNQGVTSTFVDLENSSDEEILSAIQPNTKLIWIESPTNPTLRIIDIPRIAALAQSHPSQPRVLVDNTFLSPYFSSPLQLGADIVVYSVTKYINGHSDVVMGAAILPARHAEWAEELRFGQNASGAVPSAHDAWLAQRGTKTLHLRMKQHAINGLAVAQALEGHPLVERVTYPGLKSHPRQAQALKSVSDYARNFVLSNTTEDGDFPFGGMISFVIRGGLPAAEAFLRATHLFICAESLGGVESLSELPALMTHGSIPPEEREKLGISDGLIRLSCGVEETEDLVEDVLQALGAVEATP